MKALLDFLRNTAAHIRTLEADAHAALHEAGNEAHYRELMVAKARLLANLAHNAKPLLEHVPASHRQAIGDRLQAMSASAQRSLDLGSVFYMSALLYPEDHTPGTPNDLEKWLAHLERLA
jgi:hypothetical protein